MLPIAIVLAVFGAALIDAALPNPAGRWRTAAVLLLFGYAFLRAASVDGLMLADSRYGIEAWMKASLAPGATIGMAGDATYLPRTSGFTPVDVPLSLPEFSAGAKPDLIVFDALYARKLDPGTPEGRFFAGFAATAPGYRRVLVGATRPPLLRLDFEGIATNLAAIGPEIEVYARIDKLDPAAKTERRPPDRAGD